MLVSSHVLSEVEQTVDRVVIIARGRLIYEGRLADLEGASAGVVVRTPTPDQLRAALAPLNVKVSARTGRVGRRPRRDAPGRRPRRVGGARGAARAPGRELEP